MSNLRVRRRAAGCALLSTLLLGGGCGDRTEPAPPPPVLQTPSNTPRATVQFGSGTVVLKGGADSVVVPVEVAEREDQRAFGLMDRDRLGVDSGMVFLYHTPQDASAGFWMYRTRIPLDIAFYDLNGRIVTIRQMSPCTSPDPNVCTREAANYRPDSPYVGALEVNSGFFRTHGIDVGDTVIVHR